MGKHDKKEGTLNPETRFSWQPMPDDFYKARIKTLEQENLKLAEENKTLNRLADAFERMTDPENGSFVSRAEYEDIVEKYEQLEDKYIEQTMYITDIKDALVRAALREVE